MEHAEGLPTLYIHSKRPEWGLAIMARTGRKKNRYLFQDGRMRAFPVKFCHFMQPADKPLDVAERVAKQLASQLDGHSFENPPAASPSRSDRVSLEDQIKIFGKLFPGGFQDPDYIKTVRYADKRRKRHRDPAVEDARAQLSADNLEAMIAAEDYAGVMATVKRVIDGTSLCSTRDKSVLGELPEELYGDFATAVRDLLHGESAFFDRFTRIMAVLDHDRAGRVTWPLATVLPALLDPDHHVVVKPSVFRKQAEWMAPRLPYNKLPNAGLYERFRRMAAAVGEKLTEAGHPPRDMFDVYDFIWSTLRPKALKLLDDDGGADEAA